MFRHPAMFALVGIVALGIPGNPTSTTSGSWHVDTRHSDAQLITDGTTDYGKTKINVALGVARVNGMIVLNNNDPAKSSVNFRMYPATSMAPPIDEDGQFLSHWVSDLANHTLLCFHSKTVTRRPDGRLQATGTLVLTRVDRNVEVASGEAYAGPVYGAPILHRVSHDATFVFDLPADGKAQKEGEVTASGSTSLFREDFPQLVKTVVSTYWPPVVQDKQCQTSDASEAYSGSQCTGTFLETPGLPEAPHAANGEDVGVQQNFNAVVGNHLTIVVHLRLAANNSGERAVAGGY